MIATPAAYDLMHQGTLVLARMESNGVRVDEEYLASTLTSVEGTIKAHEEEMRADPLYRNWRKLHGERLNLGSREQLSELVFNPKTRGGLGYVAKSYTATGRAKADEDAFEGIKETIVKSFLAAEKLKHLKANYFEGIYREICNGYIHPNYNLNTAITYRSSSDHPNFQNIPVRDPEVASLIRKCYVARGPNRCIVEIDLSGAEVRVAACYHKDPTMLAYIKDPTKDMHRDMAAQIYKIKPEQVSKAARRVAKGAFVFAQFYGDYYVNCAKSLWHALEREHLTTAKGNEKLKDLLADQGITRMGACESGQRPESGTFEAHLKEVEDHFWNVRFPKYGKWKKTWYANYLEKGFFDTLTGFHLEGVFSRNDAINYPVQGSAFHCLLWALIKLQKMIDNRVMDALLIGQIHDSILADVAVEQVPAYVTLARRVLTQQLPAAWSWIITPIEVEVEVSPPGGSWFDKRPYHMLSA